MCPHILYETHINILLHSFIHFYFLNLISSLLFCYCFYSDPKHIHLLFLLYLLIIFINFTTIYSTIFPICFLYEILIHTPFSFKHSITSLFPFNLFHGIHLTIEEYIYIHFINNYP